MNLGQLRQTLPYRAMEFGRGPHKVFNNPPVPTKKVVWVTGGLGDLILTLPVVEAVQEKLDETVICYVRYPEVARFLSKSVEYRDEKEFIPVGADHWITINCLVLYNFQNNFDGFRNPMEREMFLNYQSFLSNKDWQFLVQNQPHMENFTGTRAVEQGLNRRTLPFAILGLEPRDTRRDIDNDLHVLDEPFITVHHGFDSANSDVKTRATKNWDLESWEQMVYDLKTRTRISVVQLGSTSSPKIVTADYDLRGQYDIIDALKVLSKSRLHIDTESGLVHAAHMFGVRSVVLFGPTNLEFFAYPENVNIKSDFCGNCWWLTNEWMAKCPAGYIAPLCMDKIGPQFVVEKALEALGEQ